MSQAAGPASTRRPPAGSPAAARPGPVPAAGPDPLPGGANRWFSPETTGSPVAGNSAVFHPLTPLAVPLLNQAPPLRRTFRRRPGGGAAAALPSALPGGRTSSGTATRQAGNDTQSRSEHPQDHPQSKPDHRNLGAERTAVNAAGTARGTERTRPAAQIRWQKPADGSEAMAVTQIRWHRTIRNEADLRF